MSSDSIFKTNWNDTSEIDTSYTRLCVPALISACFGLATFLVYFTPWFFFLGVIAILLSFIALWAIRNAEGLLTGTPLAYFGLCCAVVALVSVSVFWQAYQHGVRQEADQFFRLWFATFQQGDMPREEAYQLIVSQAKEFHSVYASRSQAADVDEWWKGQYKDLHRDVHQYVENELIRVLLALGDRATISHYKTIGITTEPAWDIVSSVYAVTFQSEWGETETFFVRISGRRMFPPEWSDFRDAGWRLEGMPTFYLPEKYAEL